MPINAPHADLSASQAPPAPAPPEEQLPARASGTSVGEPRAVRTATANPAELVRAALIVVFVLLGLQLLWQARLLALTAFLGVLFGLGAIPAVDALERRGMRRGVASPLIIFGVIALILSLGAWAAPTLASQSQELRVRFPEAIQKAEVWLTTNQPRLLDAVIGSDEVPAAAAAPIASVPNDSATTTPVVGASPKAARHGRLVAAFYAQADQFNTIALGILTSTVAVVGGCVLVLFLAVYIAAEPDLYKRGLLLLFNPPARRRLSPVLTAIAVKLRRWLGTQAIAMLIIGVASTLLLSLIGVRAALPLGVIAGIFEFIPNVGPTLAAVPAVAMAFIDSPQKALIVVAAYVGIQFIETNLITPYLMQERLDLPPALTIMAQVVMAYVFGLMGLFVATPLLAAVFVAVQRLHVEEDPAPAGSATGLAE